MRSLSDAVERHMLCAGEARVFALAALRLLEEGELTSAAHLLQRSASFALEAAGA